MACTADAADSLVIDAQCGPIRGSRMSRDALVSPLPDSGRPPKETHVLDRRRSGSTVPTSRSGRRHRASVLSRPRVRRRRRARAGRSRGRRPARTGGDPAVAGADHRADARRDHRRRIARRVARRRSAHDLHGAGAGGTPDLRGPHRFARRGRQAELRLRDRLHLLGVRRRLVRRARVGSASRAGVRRASPPRASCRSCSASPTSRSCSTSSLGLDLTFWQILEAGLFPFIIGGLVKAGIAALIIPGAWALVRKVDASKKS